MSAVKYPGVHNAPEGAMDRHGNIIRDAWVFGILPETETGEGWTMAQLEAINDQVAKAWDEHGGLPSMLPDELREKHQRIYTEAIAHAKDNGWDPDRSLQDEA